MPLTDLLNHWQLQGKATPEADFGHIYDELKRLARAALAREGAQHTLQATELVAEVYLAMERQRIEVWQNRLQFFSVISLLMRRILVDHARKKRRLKRGDPHLKVTLIEEQAPGKSPQLDALEVHHALEALAKLDARHGLIAELKLFGGFTDGEVADIMSLSSRTIKRDWRIIKGWMRHYLKKNPPPPEA